MISSVSGRVAAVGADRAVIEVSGIGLAVQCTPATTARLRVGTSARLATSLVVREDSLTLYGFLDEDEREVFELLQNTSGVGPRLAQAVLSVHSAAGVRTAVSTGDAAALTRVPGIGPKGAQRMLLELRDRLSPAAAVANGGRVGEPARWREQVRAALTGLGWAARDVDDALAVVSARADEAPAAGAPADVAGLLRASLQVLGSRS